MNNTSAAVRQMKCRLPLPESILDLGHAVHFQQQSLTFCSDGSLCCPHISRLQLFELCGVQLRKLKGLTSCNTCLGSDFARAILPLTEAAVETLGCLPDPDTGAFMHSGGLLRHALILAGMAGEQYMDQQRTASAVTDQSALPLDLVYLALLFYAAVQACDVIYAGLEVSCDTGRFNPRVNRFGEFCRIHPAAAYAVSYPRPRQCRASSAIRQQSVEVLTNSRGMEPLCAALDSADYR